MNNFWKDALKYGAIIGLLMAATYIFERWLVFEERMPLMFFVWVLSAVAYIVLLYRFTRQRRTAYYPVQDGFSFAQGFGFLMAMVLVVAVITGIAEFVYINLVVGQPEFSVRSIDASMNFAARFGALSAAQEQVMLDAREHALNNPVSTISTAWSTMWSLLSRLFFGCIVALILAATLKREPKPFTHVE